MSEKIAFLDIEVSLSSENIDFLGVLIDEISPKNSESIFSLKTKSLNAVSSAISQHKISFICGHNFVDFDKEHLAKNAFFDELFKNTPIIDTLYLSMLLCPTITTHKLNKPYKNAQINIENNPLEDARLTKALFEKLDTKFNALSDDLKAIFTNLLCENERFKGYFKFKNLQKRELDIYEFLKDKIHCQRAEFNALLEHYKIELAFIISFINSGHFASFSSVILCRFPQIFRLCENLLFNCESVNLEAFAEDEFDIKEFRKFEGIKEQNLFNKKSEISQRDIVMAALKKESFLAILPTGGGKTFTFQLPALIKAKALKSLTIVISPLQALMKNQVDGFKNKNQNFIVAAISGYLDPLSRAETLRQVGDGLVDILYLAPEALRSNSIFNALKRRVIERFVIDEAHCFSAWGHDFRQDYYFIADTIKELEKAEFQPKIPVSCFTATAKMEVIKDIKDYLAQKLDEKALEFIASSERYNLTYEVISVSNSKEKFKKLLQILSERFYDENGTKRLNPTIIYIPQNARECKEIDKKLKNEANLADLEIEPFYAKLDKDIEDGKRNGRNKAQILQGFLDNEIDIIIATTAFGMGIDKPDIMTIIHYEQSDSLESYMQESGRGARNIKLQAKCVVLYARDEFNKKFAQLNHAKLEFADITSVLNIIKKWQKNKDEIYISKKDIIDALNIDTKDDEADFDNMIDTAILELEKCGIIKRGRNKTNIFATSITPKDEMQMEFIHKIIEPKKSQLEKYSINDKVQKQINMYKIIILIMQNIIQASKNRTIISVDDLADVVGVSKKHIFRAIYECQELKFLDYKNDISVFINKDVKKDLKAFFELETALFKQFFEYRNSSILNLKEVQSDEKNLSHKKILNKTQILKRIVQSWVWLCALQKVEFKPYFKKHICHFEFEDFEKLKMLIDKRKKICEFIINKLYEKLSTLKENEIEFSSNALKNEFEQKQGESVFIELFHHCLVFLHDMLQKFKIRKGRLIYYQAYKIEKLKNEDGNFKINEPTPYKKRDYNASLQVYYERKIAALHILIAFLEMVLKDGYEKAKFLMKDYFTIAYEKFLKIYKIDEKMIKIPLTPEKYREILHDLDEKQRQIFDDKNSQSILVLAGPGSGKTKTLVHKIASLIMIEHNKPEFFLMLAHSRAAVSEFKERIERLVGAEIYNMKIFTFHAFALYLLGEKIDGENELKSVLQRATQGLKDGTLKLPKLKMLVIDEFQDIGVNSYAFIKEIYAKMSDDKKIIAVGDDDQCIKNFGNDKADIALISRFEEDFKTQENGEFEPKFKKYFLLANYRSSANITALANAFRKEMINAKFQLKSNENLIAKSKNKGKITLIFYKNSSFFENMIECVKRELSDDKINSIALLFRTNDEVLLAHSLLLKHNIDAKYLINKDEFKLGDLVELQDFAEFWQNENLNFAQTKFDEIYKNSTNYKLAKRVIERFLNENNENEDFQNPNSFKEFLKEIDFSEFESTKSRVIVSTMHKAKGKEFDSVFMGVEDNFCDKTSLEYDTRLLYVALSRAKINLQIHTQNARLCEILTPFCDENLSYEKRDSAPNEICLAMSLKDLYLEFRKAQYNIQKTRPIAGEKVQITQKGDKIFICKNGFEIATLSNDFQNKIAQKVQENYHLTSEAIIENIVLWTKKSKEKNSLKYKQVLCKIFLKKQA